MSTGTTIRVVSDTATPELTRWLSELGPAKLAARVGPRLQRLTMEHLAALGPNTKGWPSTGFYEKFARNVRWLPQPDGVAVAILPVVIKGRQVGLQQRVFGGVIRPVSAKMLAIPISPVSYGKVPSDFPDLFLLKTPKGAYLVQRGEKVSEKTGRTVRRRGLGGHAGRRLRANLNFLFVLKASVSQTGNRNVLPSDSEYLETAMYAAANLPN